MCVYMYMCVCIHIYIYIYIYVCVYTYICIHTSLSLSLSICMCIYIYILTYVGRDPEHALESKAAPHVILVFSVNMSGCFQGYAKMMGPAPGWTRELRGRVPQTRR